MRLESAKKLAGAVAVVISFVLASGAQSLAQTWPQRTVKLMVPLGPGSGADVTARLLADHLSKRWGQPVIVENRPGADGIIGLTAFLTGTDDHVLLFTPTGTFTSHPFLHEKLAYDQNEFVPIARVTKTLISITVPTSVQTDSPAE